jgi:hypothetical protein
MNGIHQFYLFLSLKYGIGFASSYTFICILAEQRELSTKTGDSELGIIRCTESREPH